MAADQEFTTHEETRQMQRGLKLVSREEIEKHIELGECWITIHGNVYNVTHYKHPAGSAILWKYNGKDCTKQFDEIGHSMESLIYDIDSSCLMGPSEEAHLEALEREKLSEFRSIQKQGSIIGGAGRSRQGSARQRSSVMSSQSRTSTSSSNGSTTRKRFGSISKKKCFCRIFNDYDRQKYHLALSLLSSILFFGGLLFYLKMKRLKHTTSIPLGSLSDPPVLFMQEI
ncbi:hypothetical protein ACO0RG_004123 [Hanseniaspora osmophila]|uniref:Cytochrome b5 heme-binding domain-containing protein n=1 Tax=Hanseniaspora osmophila TaxID=56408 RepID=A0A1E5RBN8_9ASCO|nr:hypothetical protein AWRI3579_g2751 [Hanseniaspora osmophila]